ncbi:hypothetical protein [Haloplasma contractile]|uniref:Uncharacterized protein n=1 Tax=Haloplasma contractile SSD-17B TaxID=1033810 RepID=F7PWD6_9MOLU|nr:hypothetical protein [Haloplasma contractile]ERJ13287.1 hypothetical protein HLPCO_000916 [Haloplasma contractile SSD-17B]
MKVYVTVKQLGKKKSTLTKKAITISDDVDTLKELLSEMITTNILTYNEQKQDSSSVQYLTSEEIDERAQVGKVGFGTKYTNKEVSTNKTIKEALQSFEDGLYRVFIEDEEIESLEAPISLTEGVTLTFVKLTMLAGRMW